MNTRLPFDKTTIEEALTTRFSTVAASFADHEAVVSATETLSYRDLERQANGIAYALEEHLGTGNEPVLLLLPHEALMIVSILGVIKANKAYVALDLSTPPAKVRAVQAQIQARVVITNAHLTLAGLFDPEMTAIVRPQECLATDCLPTATPTADSLAGIFFTSGSTGHPKGVKRTHRFILHRTWFETNADQIGPDDRIALLYRTSFGASVADLANALLNGATLCLFDLQTQSLSQLTNWLQAEKMTRLHLPIQLYRQWLNSLTPFDHLPYIRQVTPSGQQIRRDYQRGWPHFGPDCLFVSRLSSTETGLITRLLISPQTPLDTEVTPVGMPTPDKVVRLLDQQGQPVTAGEIGEIVVQSPYLASGYWQQPELTRKKFVLDSQDNTAPIYYTGDLGRLRPDGQLEFLGRKDEMIKIRGYRVELGAIEGALLSLSGIKEAVVIAQELPNGDKRLVAYLVPSGAPTVSALRKALNQSLPDYSVPSLFVYLDALPLTPNGKIDRGALPEPENRRPELDTPYMPPRDAYDAQLVALWEEVLGINGIGIHDNFFDLGGHSIALMNLLSQIKAQFGQEIAIATFLQEPTIEKMAAELQDGADSEENAGSSTTRESIVTKVDPESRELVVCYLFGQVIKPRQPTLKQRVLDNLPFESRVKLFTLFCQRDFVQKRFFRQERELISRFLEATELAEDNPSDVITLYLMRLLCNRFCRGFLARSLRHDFDNYVRISGQEILEKESQKGQGVILVSIHNLFVPGVLPIILKHLGHHDLMLFRGKAVLKLNARLFRALRAYFGDEQEATVRAKFLSTQLDGAQRTLKQGGIVRIVADGASGGAVEITLPVLGRLRRFKTGFAELALKTGATVIPVSASIERTGFVAISFLPPLNAASPTIPHEERVMGLVKQYVDFMEDKWRTDPGNLHTRQMRNYLAAPQHARIPPSVK